MARESTYLAVPHVRALDSECTLHRFPEEFTQDKDENWRAYTEELAAIWLPEELNAAVVVDNVMLVVPGNEDGPLDIKLRDAFESLHNLAYHLAQSSWNRADNVSLDEIVVHNAEHRWDLWFINEYGSVGRMELQNGEVV